MKLIRFTIFALFSLTYFGCQPLERGEIEMVLEQLEPSFLLPVSKDRIPRSLEKDGTVRLVKSKDWCSGFFPGVLWYAYELSGEGKYKSLAKEWTDQVESEKDNTGDHDLGFKIGCSFGNGYRLTQDPHYKEVIIESAVSLASRFNANVGSIKSWDTKPKWAFPVIIDNMMNLELLFKATALSGDSTFYKIAYRHALTTLKNHFREDNSSYHVVDYDPVSGEVASKGTHQGLNDQSSWARGQAWGLYGFTMAYQYTGDQKFLDQAVSIYHYIFSHPTLPEDLIPYWDYNDLVTESTPRDASAAAIASSALYQLGKLANDEEMFKKADKIITSLSGEPYLAKENASQMFILDHSTGNKNRNDEVDVPIIYADYYFLEALLRKYNRSSKVVARKPILEINFDNDKDTQSVKSILGIRHVEIASGAGIDNSDGIKLSYVGNELGSARMVKDIMLPYSCKEATLNYAVKFEQDFQFTKTGKLHGLGPLKKVTGGKTMRPDGWSARITFIDNGLKPYVYHQDLHGQYGDGQAAPGFKFKRGEYYDLAIHVKVNTPASASNGAVNIYADGRKIMSYDSLRLRGVEGDSTEINQFLFSTFHGGHTHEYAPKDSAGNFRTVVAWFDQFEVYEGHFVRAQSNL